MGEDDRLKDSRMAEQELKIGELTNRIIQLEDELKISQGDLAASEELVHSYEQKIKEHNQQVNRDKVWSERLNSMQRTLQDLSQQWLRKER